MKIQLTNVEKYYGTSHVLNNLGLEIDSFNSIGIIGESGCGKSTLLRLLAGIEDPDSGDIFVNSVSPITNKKDFQQHVGVVFQHHNLFPHLTVRQNITLILQKIKKQEVRISDKRIDDLLAKLYLTEIQNNKPHEISGGQAQRASIARALSTDPSLMFLDEPTAALDPILTREVLNAVNDLKENGREFIFVTHEIDFLRKFADYIIFMQKGTIVEHGPEEILENPRTTELAHFLSVFHGEGKDAR